MIYTAIDTFYLTDEQLRDSPSRKDGIDEATENALRVYGCDLIQESGIFLKLRQNQIEPNERKWLAALLSLAVQMITTNLVPTASFLLPIVKKLKEIIERNSKSTPDCLEIIRATAMLSIWIMEENHIAKQSFQQEKINEVLENAKKTMLELERCMLLTGSVADTVSYETLSSLVQTTNDLIRMPQP